MCVLIFFYNFCLKHFYALSQNCEKRPLASVLPPVCAHGTTRLPLEGFSWNLKWVSFENLSIKNQLSLKSDNKKEDQYMFLIISCSIFLRTKNISDKSFRENKNTNFVFNSFFFENCTFYEIMWKNTVDPGRPQMTIWRRRIACWIPRATHAHSGCVILTAFSLQQ